MRSEASVGLVDTGAKVALDKEFKVDFGVEVDSMTILDSLMLPRNSKSNLLKSIPSHLVTLRMHYNHGLLMN